MQTPSTALQSEFFLCNQVLLTKVKFVGWVYKLFSQWIFKIFKPHLLYSVAFNQQKIHRKKNPDFTAGIPFNRHYQISVNNVTFSFKILTNSDKKPKILEF
eukprot:TRINITY_DN11774_c0_g2_i1.p2 TRINITY_DN11774_c0_g2~~TRINITY_DN11774_c0_g2_i1.p2  ORF type:complete len:101 (-),score=1.69 TRINITY_DN11774_c0_g2_i1:100-402(-)